MFISPLTVIYRRQKDRRLVMAAHTPQPTDPEVIAILVETIKQPKLTIEQLSRRLKKQGVQVSEQAVSNLFVCHGLDVKKTAPSR